MEERIKELQGDVLDIKISHNKELRNLLTPEQKSIFDLSYINGSYVGGDVNLPILEVNAPLAPIYMRRKNVIKTNLLNLPFKNFNVTYQRQITRRIASNLSFTFMPKTQTPFANSINNFIMGYKKTDTDIQRDKNNPILNMTTKGYRVTLDARYFLPYKEYYSSNTVSGFYFGPYVFNQSYTHESYYDASFADVDFVSDATFTFKDTGLGIQVGNQWILNERLVLDLTMLGFAYKWSQVDGSVKASVSEINLREYVKEMYDVNIEVLDANEFVTVSDKEISLTNNKRAKGVIMMFSIGYLF